MSDAERDGVVDRSETLERVSDAVFSLNADFEFTYVNRRAQDVLDSDADALLGTELWEAFPEAVGTVTQAEFEHALDTQEERAFERYNEQLDRWFAVRVYPDENGLTVIFEDVTDEKRRERQLRERQGSIDAILSNIPGTMFTLDSEGVFTRSQGQTLRAIGLEPEEAVGESVFELYAEYPTVCETCERALDGEQISTTVEVEETVFETVLQPVVDDGTVEQVVGFAYDVTGRKRREQRLKRLHETTRDLVAADSPAAVARVACEASEQILNLPLNGVHLYDPEAGGLAPTAVSAASRSQLSEVPVIDTGAAWEAYQNGEVQVYDDVRETDVYNPETPIRSEMHLPLSDHGVMLVSATTVDAFDDSDVALAKVLASNVTTVLNQLDRERELQETTNTLEAIIGASPDAVVMVDENYEVTLWNEAAEEMFGWSEAEVVGERAPFVPDEKQEEFEQYIEDIEDGNVKRGVETVRKRKDDTRLDVSLSSAKVTANGELVGYMGTFEDISQRLNYERRLERQRDNLELLTQMMSHDIRNDLQVISAYAELLAERAEGEDREYVETILSNTETAVDLTQSARDLAEAMRRTDAGREPTPLRGTLEAQIEETRASYARASVTVDGHVPGVSVLANDMLSSVFRNLLKNAVEHSDKPVPDVTVTIDVDDDAVVVRIADNGPGVPDSQKREIFGRGEKGLESEGTGIGLYLVDTLVSDYGGDVWVEDNDPEGAVFVLELDHA
jgi:PAS domain S-box-containing protein